MPILKGKLIHLRVLGLVVVACAASRALANGPAFLVSVSNTAPRLSEMLEVTTLPFATNVITTTNAGIISASSAPWSAMAFSPGGTLYGVTLAGGLGAIDPATAAFSLYANLHLAPSAPGVEELVTGAGLSFSTNGTGYVSDGFTLYSANLANGLCSNIAPFYDTGGGFPFAYALAQAPDGTLFGLFLNLFTVNSTNAEVTQIGPPSSFGGGNYPIYALSAAFGSDSNLYMVGWDNTRTNHPKLYQVNTNDGSLTALGNLPFGAQGLVALSPSNSSAPAIVFPPVTQTVMAGGAASFSVTARGTPAPAPQWYFDGTEEPNATNSTLTITNVSLTNAGTYYVVLTNGNGAVTSQVATLDVTAPILASTGSIGGLTNSILGLTTNPPTQTTLLNSNLYFSDLSFGPLGELFAMARISQAQGTSNVVVDALYDIDTQTWSASSIGDFQTNAVNGQTVPIGMAFSPSGILYASLGSNLYTVDVQTAQGTKVGSFPGGTAVGGIAFAPNGTLYGGETNLYIINPTNASVTDVGTLHGVSASVVADMKYGSDGFLYFCDGGADGNLYRLNPTNALVSVAENFASTLTGLAFVPVPTVLVAQPSNEYAVSGSAATFSADATGAAPLAYQWYFDNEAIRGATNSAFTIAKAVARNNGSYYVVVSNELGPVTSSIVTLTAYTPPTITRPPKAEVITAGQTISLSVTATGTPLAYQWQFNGTNLPGETAASLTIRGAQGNDAGVYTVLVSNPFSATPVSASASVTVKLLTPIISFPANNSVTGVSNLIVTGRVGANGGGTAIIYQLDGGAAQSAEVSFSGLTWSAAVTLAPGTNSFSVWATNISGESATVKARFIYNPFLPLAGAYYGLFSDEGSPALTNSGYFNLTLESDRIFSGDIILDGVKTPFTGQFDTNGVAALVAGHAPGHDYQGTLQLDLSGVSPMSGVLSNIAQGWTASLSAIHAGFGGTLRATNYEGSYLLAIITNNANVLAPPGCSFALASINANGNVTLSATLADGSVFTSTGTAISQSGEWPLYGSLFSGKGSVLAWVKFSPRGAANQMTSGQAMWFETAASGSHYYTNGFSFPTNDLNLMVDRYIPPAKGVAVLPSVNYTVLLYGGDLIPTLSANITISSNNAVVVTGPNTNQLSLTINASAGTFTGSFVSSATSAKTALKGVLLPGANSGFGYFLGLNQTGGILIQP
jgi:hypothetical protein